jgi:hypothetical protein
MPLSAHDNQLLVLTPAKREAAHDLIDCHVRSDALKNQKDRMSAGEVASIAILAVMIFGMIIMNQYFDTHPRTLNYGPVRSLH